MEELKNIQSVKIKVVPAGEMYRYILGSYLIFWAFCFGAISVLCLETSVTAIFTHSHGLFDLRSIIGITILIGFIYTVFTLPVFWKFAFFKKAIAPSLKYGEFLVKRLAKIGRWFFTILFV